jgi:GAF domain-containing protein
MGVISLGINLPFALQTARWQALALYGLAFLGLIAAAFLRRWGNRPRMATLLLALWVIGLTALLTDGLYGNGRALLVVLPMIALLLAGRRSLAAVLGLSIVSVGVIGALMAGGLLAAPAPLAPRGSQALYYWIAATTNLAALAIGGALSLRMLWDGLQQNLEQRQALIEELQAEQARLQVQSQQRADDLQRRLVQIRTVAEINRAISRMLDIDQLLPQVCELVRQRFDLYYVGVFLIEEMAAAPAAPAGRLPSPFDDMLDRLPGIETDQTGAAETPPEPRAYAVLKAGSGEAGRRMLAEGHKLAVGGDSMIGWATANRQPRIAQNVGQETVRFDNPHLPLTRSELALPILVHEGAAGDGFPEKGAQTERVLGAMTIQSTEEAAFDQDDILILQGIADALASAIENARLFAATQASLEEIRTLHRQYLEQAWQLETALRGEVSYTYPGGERSMDEPPAAGRLEVPIRLRDQVIGSLTIEPNPADGGRPAWSAEELALVEAVSNQAALALENARLLEDTRRKASLEHTATQITSKLWASADIDTILRTALQELCDTLGAREGWIELWPGGTDAALDPPDNESPPLMAGESGQKDSGEALNDGD